MIDELTEIGWKRLMLMTVDRIVENKHKCRQNYYNRKHADNDALCHNNSDIKTERKLHEAKRKEAEKRR